MQKADAERSNDIRGKLIFSGLIGAVFMFSVFALYYSDWPLIYALAGSLFVLFITPILLLALVLMVVSPYEAAFFAFITLLNLLRFGLGWLQRKRIYPRQMRFIRRYVRFCRWILVELKGPYITLVALWGFYCGIRWILKMDFASDEPNDLETNG